MYMCPAYVVCVFVRVYDMYVVSRSQSQLSDGCYWSAAGQGVRFASRMYAFPKRALRDDPSLVEEIVTVANRGRPGEPQVLSAVSVARHTA